MLYVLYTQSVCFMLCDHRPLEMLPSERVLRGLWEVLILKHKVWKVKGTAGITSYIGLPGIIQQDILKWAFNIVQYIYLIFESA